MNIQPMLAELAHKPFNSTNHIFETKWDGVRCIAHIENGGVRLQARSLKDITPQFPELMGLSQAGNCVLDGEIVCLDEKGRSVFNLIQQRIHNGDPSVIKWRSQHIPAVFEVFDILYLNGESVMSRRLAERKMLLEEIPEAPGMNKTMFIPEEGIAFFQAAEELGLEGIMAKDLRMPYSPGKRSPAWQKVKVAKYGEFAIAGFTAGKGWREDTIGALLLWEDGQYVGNVGTGFDERTLLQVSRLLEKLATDVCPFATPPKVNGQVVWAMPYLRCRVKYLERSNDGKLRFPVFEGLTEVKDV